MPDGNTAFPKPILSEAYKFKEAIPKIQSKTSDVINKRWVTVTKKSCSEQSTKDVEKNLKNVGITHYRCFSPLANLQSIGRRVRMC